MTNQNTTGARVDTSAAVHTSRLWFKLLLSYLFPTAAIVAGMGMVAYFASHSSMELELGRSLVAIARVGARAMARPRAMALSAGDETTRTYSNLLKRLVDLKKASRARRIILFDTQERCIIDSEKEFAIGEKVPSLAANRSELKKVFAGQEAASVLFDDEKGNKYKTGFAPVIVDAEIRAGLGVEGSASFFGPLEQLRSTLFIIGTVALILVVLVTLLVSRKITRPLDALAQAARQMERGEFEGEIHMDTKDEIAVLADTLNDMREAIKKRDEQMQMMLSGIAHEVRNPLGGMSLFVGLLQEEVENDQARAHVNRINNELEYLSRVVTDFLNFARNKPPQITKADAKAELEQVLGLCIAEAREKNVSIELDVANEVRSVYWDIQQMRRAVMNLVKNSIQACQQGGEVKIRMNENGDRILLFITDNGCGIDEDNQENIFKPFFTTRQKGTGLGLALVKKTIEEHGGKIELLRTDEQLTTFMITLPRNLQQRAVENT